MVTKQATPMATASRRRLAGVWLDSHCLTNENALLTGRLEDCGAARLRIMCPSLLKIIPSCCCECSKTDRSMAAKYGTRQVGEARREPQKDRNVQALIATNVPRDWV